MAIPRKLPVGEEIMRSTVRLECLLNDGSTSTGTGFFFQFDLGGKSLIPVIVTNKHVIENSIIGILPLTRRGEDGGPSRACYEQLKIENFESRWIAHPDIEVDLAILPLGRINGSIDEFQSKYFFTMLGNQSIADQKDLSQIEPVEEIIMIGYPNGIWDEVNNLPIIRRGAIATSPRYDYNGSPEFLIDCACFPGSSGSPVLIYIPDEYIRERVTVIGAGVTILLGILYEGSHHVAEGEIIITNLPLQKIPISLSEIPNNLGFVIKAHKLNDFRPLLSKLLDQNIP